MRTPNQRHPDPLLTVKDVSEFFDVSPYTVRTWLKEGKLNGQKLNNRRWRVLYSECVRFAQLKYGESA